MLALCLGVMKTSHAASCNVRIWCSIGPRNDFDSPDDAHTSNDSFEGDSDGAIRRHHFVSLEEADAFT
jgi:hypothetical protein